jgi:hypothetical protein
VCNVQIQEAPPKQAQEPDKKPYQWRELYAPANIPNWALAALAGWAGVMALRTLRGINKQAALMEKTLVLQFRPKIVVRSGDVHISNVANIGEMPTGSLDFTVANTGGSDAEIIAAEVEVTVIQQLPIILFSASEVFGRFKLRAGEAVPRSVTLSGQVNEAVRWIDSNMPGTIGRASRNIYFVGIIWYEDDLHIKRSMGFYRRYDADSRRFVPIDKEDDREYGD